MKNKLCPAHKECRNGYDGCYSADPKTCVRFLPLDGTNLTKITGIIETPPEIDCDKFSQFFTNWVVSMGWSFCGGFSPQEDMENTKCKYCNDTGLIKIAPNVRGVEKCPYCQNITE